MNFFRRSLLFLPLVQVHFFFLGSAWAFPTWEEWLELRKIVISADVEVSEVIPQSFLEDVKIALRPETEIHFSFLNHTVFFEADGSEEARLKGAYELESAIEELRLTHVRVPKMLFVIHEQNKKQGVFVERIYYRQAATSKKELKEAFQLIQKTGFSSFLKDNLITGVSAFDFKPAIYFVRTIDPFDRGRASIDRRVFAGCSDLVQSLPGLSVDAWHWFLKNSSDQKNETAETGGAASTPASDDDDMEPREDLAKWTQIEILLQHFLPFCSLQERLHLFRKLDLKNDDFPKVEEDGSQLAPEVNKTFPNDPITGQPAIPFEILFGEEESNRLLHQHHKELTPTISPPHSSNSTGEGISLPPYAAVKGHRLLG